MITLPEYQILTKIYESSRSVVYRAQRYGEKPLPVILKVLKEEYPHLEDLTRYQYEYDLLHSLQSKYVIEVYALEKYHNTRVIVLEDFGGESLKYWTTRQAFTLPEFLALAIEIVDGLTEVHAAKIIHKDLNPTNIIFNPLTNQLKIIDFGIATRLPCENQGLKNPDQLEGTLAYISPEQTGRMNRIVDYRTDFYALGVTFYELLTQRLPFEAEEPMALVHCHLAKQPPLPHRLNPLLPEMVSKIVMKLLEKNAEARYQTTWGIRADLDNCLQQWRNRGEIASFSLGSADLSDRLPLSQKLYGRDQEIAVLTETLELASLGNCEVIFVSGPAGVGKSILVPEIYKTLSEKRGYFVAGKFDPFQQDVPYLAIVQAVRALMAQLLTESDSQVGRWQEALLKVLEQQGQIIIEVIPELAKIIGPQPVVPELLKANEAQNRFQWVWKKFLSVFCQAAHPLVIFLDDLQWADMASLTLMTSMVNTPYLLLVGAYQETTPALSLTITEMQNLGVSITFLPVAPLMLANLTQWLLDIFKTEITETQALAEIVLAKTQGYPFFVNEFLKSLYVGKLLKFIPPYGALSTSTNSEPHWQWDLEKIKACRHSDNVIELLSHQIQTLTENTQQILQRAACIGNQFNLQILTVIYQKCSQDDLREAIMEGLIMPLTYATSLEYKFTHERLRHAIYSMLPPDQRRHLHWQIGRYLLENLPVDQAEQKVFAVVEQLNLGLDLLTLSPGEREELAILNLLAGRKAKASGAYEMAFHNFKMGITLLGENGWQQQYELTLALFIEAAEISQLGANFREMESFVDQVLQEAKTLLDKVSICEINIQAWLVQNELSQAIELALTVLELLHIKFPKVLRKWHFFLGLWRTQLRLRWSTKNLLDRPKMTDPVALAAMRILSHLYAATYKAAPDLFPFIVLQGVDLSLKHGNAPQSALAYATYGLILLEKDLEAAYQFGQLALDLVERFQELKARTWMVVNNYIRPWCQPIKESLAPLRQAYQLGLESGEIEFAVMAANAYCALSYVVGNNLAALSSEITSYNQTLTQLRHEGGLRLNKMFHQVIANLLEQDSTKPPPYYLLGEHFNENKSLPLLYHINDRTALALFHFNKLHLCYLFEQYPQAAIHANLVRKHLNGLRGWVFMPLFYFYDSLTTLALERPHFLHQVTSNQTKMQKWAHHAPMNYLHKYDLVAAETAHVLGNKQLAREYFHKAIAVVQENEYPQEEALAYELTAKFYRDIHEKQLAYYYFKNAHHAYQRWGAVAKVKDLETRYAEIFLQTKTVLPKELHLTTSISYSTQPSVSNTLDLNSVLKASQAIFEEILLDKLLAKLIHVVIENTGAQRGVLLLKEASQWVIGIQGEVEQPGVIISHSSPQAWERLPRTLINYVTRLQETVVLYEASQSGKFTRDAYFAQYLIKSALCVPLLNQGHLVGILYLENNLASGAFTSTRLEILNLLVSQLAIAITNAQLYADTNALNAKLRESEERFRVIAETTPIPLIITRFSDDTILYANAQATAHFGLAEPMSIAKLYHPPEERDQIREMFKQRGYLHNYELQLKKLDQSLVWVELFSHPIIYKHEKVLLSAIYDITDRKRVEEERSRFTQELRESEERFRVIAETTPIPLLIMRISDLAILYANAQIATIFGLSPVQLVGYHRAVDFYESPQEQAKLMEIFQTKGLVKNYELQLKKIDGTPIWVAMFIQPMVFKKEPAMLGAFYDITDRRRAEEERIRFIQEREAKNVALQMNEQLQQEINERKKAQAALAKANAELSRLATLDGLTQLANRRSLDESLLREWRRMLRESAPLSFILCDIDYFKRYNDNYGHLAGDDCLRQVAQAMNRAIKRPGDLIARYGGEEFAVILPNTHAEGALKVAMEMQRLVQELQIVHAYSQTSPYVTLSLGVATLVPTPTLTPKRLVNMADNALYEAKGRGRNCVISTTTSW